VHELHLQRRRQVHVVHRRCAAIRFAQGGQVSCPSMHFSHLRAARRACMDAEAHDVSSAGYLMDRYALAPYACFASFALRVMICLESNIACHLTPRRAGQAGRKHEEARCHARHPEGHRRIRARARQPDLDPVHSRAADLHDIFWYVASPCAAMLAARPVSPAHCCALTCLVRRHVLFPWLRLV